MVAALACLYQMGPQFQFQVAAERNEEVSFLLARGMSNSWSSA